MQIMDKLLTFWPVLAASLVFLLLGLWWQHCAARAMELSPKPLSWVRNYRAPGNPYRPELLGRPRLGWGLILGVLGLALALTLVRIVNTSMVIFKLPWTFLAHPYGIFLGLLSVVGAVSLFFLLNLLFDSGYAALLGILLFAASPTRGHGEVSMLALCLLLLLLWLRAEGKGLGTELLYFAACLVLAPIVALRQSLIWLLPLLVGFHWYKLLRLRREGALSGGALALRLGLSLLVWGLTALLCLVMLRFLYSGFQLQALAELTKPAKLRETLDSLLRGLRANLIHRPTRGMVLDLLLDAPLLGFGFWGCFAAWTMARARRSVRGSFPLIILGAQILIWLLTGRCLLVLGLSLTTACILKNGDLGKRRTLGLSLILLGLCWYIFLQLAVWMLPLAPGLLERLL